MENKQSGEEDVSSAKAVFLGALAPGVNVRKISQSPITCLCLSAMLGLAFSSSDSWLILHVTILVLITGTLFMLLSSFLAQTGLVSVEHQIQEMGLASKDLGVINKRSS
ncbi:uncharacterized protein LOC130760158 isoform X2 [Actinidia eriantha]|uniref:uncharacterized protein LOC130760158 isoform X2 n=1 Tax=Actinidia eriantha TaxID=165200 RepID=UPI002585E528|nr:uncharacterized protein LOC130760158 isoform X2 [Actinidia eriantha]